MRQHKRTRDRDFASASKRAASAIMAMASALTFASFLARTWLPLWASIPMFLGVSLVAIATIPQVQMKLKAIYRVLVSETKKDRKSKPLQANTRFWEKAGLLFGHKTRKRIYDPAIGEIREDYLLARRLCRSKADYYWIKICFAIRGARAFLRSAWDSLLQPIIRMIPGWLRRWWNLFS
jgi:hypothetical protein